MSIGARLATFISLDKKKSGTVTKVILDFNLMTAR